jgi:hypothetical protein
MGMGMSHLLGLHGVLGIRDAVMTGWGTQKGTQ